MNLPNQAEPVIRDFTTARFTGNGIMPQGCDTLKKIACAGALLACAAPCATVAGCVVCLAGVGASGCIDCL